MLSGIRKIAPQKIAFQKITPQKIALQKTTSQKIAPQKIVPYESFPCENYPSEFSPQKVVPCENSPPPRKITPNEIFSPLRNHKNERKNKITKFFALKKVLQYNILIKITKVLFDTQMFSQKILGLDTFFTE